MINLSASYLNFGIVLNLTRGKLHSESEIKRTKTQENLYIFSSKNELFN